MKEINWLKKGIFLAIISLLFSGCTKLLFENTIPKKGEIVKELPDFFYGKFLKKGEKTFYDIELINEKHCIVYGTDYVHKDSINTLIANIKDDSTNVEFKDSALFITEKDTTRVIKLRLEDSLYFTEREPIYEFNLEQGYFIDDFDQLHKKKAILKRYKDRYYLNIIDEHDKWLAIWLEKTNDDLLIRHSTIADTSFADNLVYYNRMTTFKKVADKTYLVNPSDEELFNLLEEPKLFTQEIWIRVDDGEQWDMIWAIIGIILMLLFIIFLVLRRPNHNRRLK